MNVVVHYSIGSHDVNYQPSYHTGIIFEEVCCTYAALYIT